MTSRWLLHSNAYVVLNIGENTACTLDSIHWWTACQVQGYWGLLGTEERRLPRSPVSSEVGDPRLFLERGGERRKSGQSKKRWGPLGLCLLFHHFSKVRRAGNLSPGFYLQPLCSPFLAVRAQFKGQGSSFQDLVLDVRLFFRLSGRH